MGLRASDRTGGGMSQNIVYAGIEVDDVLEISEQTEI